MASVTKIRRVGYRTRDPRKLMTAASQFPGSRTERGRSSHAVPSSEAFYLRSALLPAGMVALICVAAGAAAVFSHASVTTLREVLVGVACGTVVMLLAAFVTARTVSRRVDAELRATRQVAQRGQAELQQTVDRLMRGEQLEPLLPVPARGADGDPFRALADDIEQTRYQAAQGMLRVASQVFGGRGDQRVEIFVNLARRMQSLVHREIEMLDDLEARVEDPDLLKGLFTVDHLATRLRRQSESLAVLGGSSSRRQWTRQVTMHEVLRAAVAEVEQYSRVKVVPPVEGVLRGSAVTDVIHLIAELVENATKFSAPHTTALLRAQHVAAGVAIEVEDRGLGMLPADQHRMNDLLADPTRMDVDELLRDGRIGLYVVAILARRHGIRVQLQSNIYGGTQAVMVLPKALLDAGDGRELPGPAAERDPDGDPRLALVSTGRPGGGPAAVTHAGATQAGSGPAGRSASEQAQSRLPIRPPVSGASSSPAPWATDGVPANSAGTSVRPPLPKRQAQTSVASPAQDRLEERSDTSAARSTEPPADQMTGLMADFLRGVRSAEEEDSSARD
jgi:signal transduction histidine kinase